MRYLDDFPCKPINDVWEDTRQSGFGEAKVYAVQTEPKAIARCLLVTTDPGDLVFDPTCGSGTTSVVAEQWGRRWITCDTGRVAISLAKLRLMTAAFDYYELADPANQYDDERTEAHCYLGLFHALDGRKDEARKHLEWVEEHGNREFSEYPVAVNHLERLK